MDATINGADSAANCGEIERSGEARIESVSADRKLSRHWNRCLAKVAFDLGSIKSAPGVERLFPPSTRDIQTSIQNSLFSNRAINPINSLSLSDIR